MGVDSLRLIRFEFMNFINLLKCFFFKFYSRYPAMNCRLTYKRQRETIQDSSDFLKESFLLPKTGESLREKPPNCFFKSVCLFVGLLLFFLFSNKKNDGNQSVSVLSCFWNYKKWILATDQQGNVDYILLPLCPASLTYKNSRGRRIVDGLPLFGTQRSVN